MPAGDERDLCYFSEKKAICVLNRTMTARGSIPFARSNFLRPAFCRRFSVRGFGPIERGADPFINRSIASDRDRQPIQWRHQSVEIEVAMAPPPQRQ